MWRGTRPLPARRMAAVKRGREALQWPAGERGLPPPVKRVNPARKIQVLTLYPGLIQPVNMMIILIQGENRHC